MINVKISQGAIDRRYRDESSSKELNEKCRTKRIDRGNTENGPGGYFKT